MGSFESGLKGYTVAQSTRRVGVEDLSHARLACVSILILAAAAFAVNTADNDLWGHIRYGNDFLLHGVVKTDPYSYTAAGLPWFEHEWGAEVLFALLYDGFGAPGLILFKAALGTAAIGLILRLVWNTTRNVAAIAIMAVPVVFGLYPFFSVRPQIFTLAFFAVTLYVIQRSRDGNTRAVWILPPLMVVWVNVHAGFVAGLGILAVATVEEWVASWRRGTSPPYALSAALICSMLATCLSPYGPAYPAMVLPSVLMRRPDITEWRSFSLASVRDFPTLILLPALAVISVATLISTRARRDGLQMMLLALVALLSFRHERHAPFFFITSLWVVPQHLAAGTMLRATPPRRASVIRALLTVLAGLWTAHALVGVGHLAVRATSFPIGAVRFMEEQGIGGNVAVGFNWGSYLIGKCFPRCRVSMDGRYESPYPADHYAVNRDFEAGGPHWTRLLTEYPSEVALLNTGSGAAQRLPSTSGWTLVYRDPVAVLFVRDLPRFEPLIQRFRDAPATAPLEDSVFP
jgi:hypothetical protein